jgi:hypothetical protein
VDEVRQVVVQVGEGDPVLGADRLADDDLVDVVELVPGVDYRKSALGTIYALSSKNSHTSIYKLCIFVLLEPLNPKILSKTVKFFVGLYY